MLGEHERTDREGQRVGRLHGDRSVPTADRLVQLVLSRPPTGYFVMAFVLSWVWFGLALGAWGLPLQGPAGFVGTLVGPCLGAFVMPALLSGRGGVLHLLRRLVLWRVAPLWYLVAVLAWPALLVAAVLALPGPVGAGGTPVVGFGVGCLGVYLSILIFGGPLGEEPGWRGFALPGLQQRLGPLAGALVLGALRGTWHLPIYLLLVIAATRGRLSYERYRRETAVDGPWPHA
jgi:uncharacterized protein